MTAKTSTPTLRTISNSAMEQQPPPLTPEEVARLSASEYVQLGQPQTIKIFGIFHLILGGLGSLMLLWTLVIIFYGNPFMAMVGNTPEMQAQENFQNETMGVTIFTTAIHALITVLILMAGVKLIKGRRDALKFSNGYAWLSLASKVINLVVSLVYVLPKTAELMPAPAPGSAVIPSSGMEIFMIGTFAGTFIMGIIYPILSLVLLNRPNVKSWFTNQPA